MESIKTHINQYQKAEFQQKYKQLVEKTLQDEEVAAFLEEHKNSITPEMLQNSYAKLYEFVQEKERIRVTGYSQNPGFKPQLAININSIDVVYQATEEFLIQEERRAIVQRIQTLEMPKGIVNLRLTPEFIEATQGRAEVVKYLIEFNKQYQENPEKPLKGAYIYGSYGVGKTYLLGCLAGELAEHGYSSYLLHFPSLVVELKEAIGRNKVNEKLDIVKKSPILMIDDIGGESLTPWVRDDVLMVILDYRMKQQLPTFFTSNLDFERLSEHLKGVSIEDERKAQRLMERIKVLVQPIQVRGANRRD